MRIARRGLSHEPGRPRGEGGRRGGGGGQKQQKSDSWYLGAGGAPLCPQVLHRCLWSRAGTTGYPGSRGPTGVSPTALASAQPFSKSNYRRCPVGTWWMLGNKDRNLTRVSLKVQRQQIGFLIFLSFFFFLVICANWSSVCLVSEWGWGGGGCWGWGGSGSAAVIRGGFPRCSVFQSHNGGWMKCMRKCCPIGVIIAIWRIRNYGAQPSDKGLQIKKRSWARNGNLFGEE